MDLYGVLGVARTASAADIERAYGRLARRYHPGVNPGDRVSAEMYRKVQDAYGVLADAARRREYDGGGRTAVPAGTAQTVTLEGFDFTAVADGAGAATFAELFADVFQDAAREAVAPSRGGDLEMTAHVSFVDAARGCELPLSVTRQHRCGACLGAGQVARLPSACRRCGGTGVRRWARGHLVFTKPCDGCAGEGRASWVACPTCGGIGTAARTEVIAMAVPPGLDTGARIAVPGHGHAGARGGPFGDLYVTLEVAAHPIFRREGQTVSLTVPIAVHEAALGARVDVPTLDGVARLTVPPGTPSGRRFRIRGAGIGAADAERGDLLVDVHIVLPPVLDDASRALLREFGRLNTVDVRRHLFDRA